ncbi:MAG: DUF87 domain-containing protein [Epsilonproteobacteria bacterium]|nr:DUF87 domain-containing protein [Campylobacterota bacterium]
MLAIFATIFTISIYILFSTIFHNLSIVGAIGKAIGETNLELFGYIAYILPIFVLLPLYKLYKNKKLRNKSEIYVGWSLFLLSLLILQALVVKEYESGFFSTIIYQSLIPYIGYAGLWLIFFLTISLAISIINQSGIEEIEQILSPINRYLEKSFNYLMELYKIVVKKFKNSSTSTSLAPVAPPPTPTPTKRKRSPSKSRKKKEVTKVIKEEELSPIKEENIIDVEIEKEESIEEPKESKGKSSKRGKKSSSILVNELEENKKLLEDIDLGKVEKPKDFVLPKLDFLQQPPKNTYKVNEAEIDRKIKELLEKLKQFKIEGDVIRTYTGPLVTTFEFKPAPNVKVSKILGLQDDLAMALSAETIRIQAPIPGRDVIGIEIPNEKFQTIYLREILESKIFKNAKSPLTVALGKDIVGNPFVTDLKKLPHLLIAGTTGSGKSVGINAMILSLLFKNSPQDLKLILIDPKMLEFSIYNDIPHLLTPVIIEPKKAVMALANLVKEMERRYQLMAKEKVKNIDNYNQKAKRENKEKMPFIVVIIDELADLMMTAGKEVEYSIARLAQMARAAGIHIIVATQRPSVDVVTGLIKANLPARLSYRVGQKIDSKVILDTMGAESLLGRGDGLFTPPGITGLVRIHAPWSTEEEIEEIVEFLKAQQAPEYDESYLEGDSEDSSLDVEVELDELYEKAKEIVVSERKSSISYLQRRLQIGYNRAANIVEQLERTGVLSPPNNKGSREILI